MIFSARHVVASSAVLALAACGGGDATDPAPTDSSTPAQSTTETTSTETPISAPAETVEVSVSEAFATLPEPYKSADYDRGRRTYKLCQSCHTLNEGGPNLVGPNLYGMFGRGIGAVEGFNYSKAVQDSDIIWTPEILAEWLESPRNFLPGNNMSFAGVRKPEDRTAVIAYIMSETGYSSE
ncbi:MAG: c-type cytochrome [Henriciella sp.]